MLNMFSYLFCLLKPIIILLKVIITFLKNKNKKFKYEFYKEILGSENINEIRYIHIYIILNY